MPKPSRITHLIHDHGIDGIRIAAERGSSKVLQRIGRHVNYGHNFLEDKWDILIILDACRADLFREVIKDHRLGNRLTSVNDVYSCASTSQEFVSKCYNTSSDETLGNIHLITANGWEGKFCDTSKFHTVDEVWRFHHDASIGNTPPGPVTDNAVRAYRESSASRFIVHYLQPHAPFVHCAGKYDSVNEENADGNSQNIWQGLQEGRFDYDEIWSDYAENLRLVLDHVEVLLNNMDGDVLITADHGNGLGEWGVYGHPGYVPVPALKKVPYVRAVATDEGTYAPETNMLIGSSELRLNEHLRDLGYR